MGTSVPHYIPKIVRDFLGEMNSIGDRPERLSKLDDFIMLLETEKRKIDVFKRELPFCMHLIHDVIQMMKDEAVKYRRMNLLQLPLMVKPEKTWLSSGKQWKNEDQSQRGGDMEKMNWNWVGDAMNNGKGKIPFLSLSAGCSMFPVIRGRDENRVGLPVSGVSLVNPGMRMGNSSAAAAPVSQPPPPAYKKERRSWSRDLHRRFVDALQVLGGPEATPKQIKEHMKVDGLTNDEVKSHLQKYRLHKRKIAEEGKLTTVQVPNYRPIMMTLEEFTKGKQRNSLSGSPQGPLDLTVGNHVGGNSGGEEEGSSDRKGLVKRLSE